MPRPLRLAVAILAFGGATSVTSAQEYCVACTGPDATYRCIIGGEASVAARSTRGQLLCIKELARSGPHESCSVQRREQETCEGELRTVMFPAAPDPGMPIITEAPIEVTEPDGEAQMQTGGPGAEPAEMAPEPPPETLEDVAKDTGENLKKAGDAVTDTAKSAGSAVGNAVKKTWNCLSSFFGDC